MIQNAITEGNLMPNAFLPKTLSDAAARTNPNGGVRSGARFQNDQRGASDGNRDEASRVRISSYQSRSLAACMHVGTRYTMDSRASQSAGPQRRSRPGVLPGPADPRRS